MPSRRKSPRRRSPRKTSKKGSRRGLKLLSIKRSPKKDKKYMATFSRNGRIKKVHFGARGMSDYTKHKDSARKSRYIKRHKKHENWN